MSSAPISVYLLASDDKICPAELHSVIAPEHLSDWFQLWKPFMRERLKSLELHEYPQHPHWDWLKKSYVYDGELAMKGYAVTCKNETQGLMWVKTTGFSRSPETERSPLVYVEFIEAAPWNIKTLCHSVRYRGVGSILLRAAIELSRKEEFKGRIGLHALSQAEAFYLKCGMSDFGSDANYHSLRYFEMTENQANSFITNGENNV